jgi:hypothetical protein
MKFSSARKQPRVATRDDKGLLALGEDVPLRREGRILG